MNSLLRRGVLELDELVMWLGGMDPVQDEMTPLPRWWLVLFIEALVLFPNIRREGIPQRPILQGDN